MSEESEDFLVASLVRREWLVDGLMRPVVGPYIQYLRMQRYADNTIRSYLKAIAHFSHWGKGKRVRLPNVNETLVGCFLRDHLPVCDCQPPCARHLINARPALKHLIVVLRKQGYVCKEPLRATPASREITKFRKYLLETCGFAEATTVYYRTKHVADFLAGQFGIGKVDISSITPSDIDKCIMEYAERWRPASLSVLRSSLRSYLKFRALQGDEIRHLVAALPVLTDWSKTTLPKALSEDQLARFVQAFDITKPIGQRDYAIARCLVDLGLRGCEVANLTIESVDWRSSILTVADTKGRHVLQLPLPWQTGKAIACYLRHGRPVTTHRALFVHHEAPVGAPLHVAGIRSAMRYAFERCGLDDQFCSTHALRHTVATRLQRSGASLKDIADVLGHRSLQSTMSYTRVDLEGLRTVSLPWPGSRP